jgi:hypothetical protein
MDRYRSFQEIRDPLSDWQSLARPRGMDRQFMGARAMSQRAGAAESEFKALIEAWAVRRHDLLAKLAHHDDDIAMFDAPPPLGRPGICSSPITNPGKPLTSKSYKCASATPSLLRLPSCVACLCKVDGAWRIQHEHHSVAATD